MGKPLGALIRRLQNIVGAVMGSVSVSTGMQSLRTQDAAINGPVLLPSVPRASKSPHGQAQRSAKATEPSVAGGLTALALARFGKLGEHVNQAPAQARSSVRYQPFKAQS